MARPTKYTPELLKKAQDYLHNWEELGDIIPSVEGLAEVLDITTVTIYDWQKQEDKLEFSYTLDRIKQKQKKVLLEKGLLSVFNSNICKLALGNHGFHDKQDTNISGQLDTQATYSPEVHRFDGSTDPEDS